MKSGRRYDLFTWYAIGHLKKQNQANPCSNCMVTCVYRFMGKVKNFQHFHSLWILSSTLLLFRRLPLSSSQVSSSISSAIHADNIFWVPLERSHCPPVSGAPIRFHLSGQADKIQMVFLILPYVLREASWQLGFKSSRFPTFDEHMSSIYKPSPKANTFFLNFSVSQMPFLPHKTVDWPVD